MSYPIATVDPAPENTIFFVCDIQTKFRPAIYGFSHIVNTTNKMLQIAKVLGCEVIVTTQNAKALGPVDPAIELDSLGALHRGTFDKTLFSMLIPEVKHLLSQGQNVVLMGVETHVCIFQTAIGLLRMGITPWIIADAVSSCNNFEIPIALGQLKEAGAVITTSESLGFLLVKDSSISTFKEFSLIIKKEKERTVEAGSCLLKSLL